MAANKNLRYKGTFKQDKLMVRTDLSIFLFKEEGLHYCYCADLDLYGYGENESEARESFQSGLTEFLRYTQNKRTLTKELKRLGWKILKETKKVPHYVAPEFVDLVKKNEELNRIMTDIPRVRKYSQSIQMPAYAA
jgi:hypothetical protein